MAFALWWSLDKSSLLMLILIQSQSQGSPVFGPLDVIYRGLTGKLFNCTFTEMR